MDEYREVAEQLVELDAADVARLRHFAAYVEAELWMCWTTTEWAAEESVEPGAERRYERRMERAGQAVDALWEDESRTAYPAGLLRRLAREVYRLPWVSLRYWRPCEPRPGEGDEALALVSRVRRLAKGGHER